MQIHLMQNCPTTKMPNKRNHPPTKLPTSNWDDQFVHHIFFLKKILLPPYVFESSNNFKV